MINKLCILCEATFSPNSGRQKYCSVYCQRRAEYLRNGRKRMPRPPVQKSMKVIECNQCGESFLYATRQKHICDECYLENQRRYGRERMRRLRADPETAEILRTESRRYSRRRKATDAEYNARELERLKEWKEANPEKVRTKNKISKMRREHRKLHLYASLTVEEWNRALEYFEWTCAYCELPSDELQQEHFKPLAKGGEYTQLNIVPACPDCNQSKSYRDPFEWCTEEQWRRIIEYFASTQDPELVLRIIDEIQELKGLQDTV